MIVRLVGRKAAIVARAAVDAPPPPLAALGGRADDVGQPDADGRRAPGRRPGARRRDARRRRQYAGHVGGVRLGCARVGLRVQVGHGVRSGAGSGSDPGFGSARAGRAARHHPVADCDGSAGGAFHAVHGTLGPSLAGQPIELDYVPVDPNADTVIDHVTTGAGGRFSDVPGAPFVETIAYYAGDDDYVSSSAFCPSG